MTLFGVVELRFPVVGAMAGFTFFAETALVGVVFAMAGDTSTRRVFIAIICVAGFAFSIRMLSQQRKLGLVVVKLDIFPRFVVVTSLAFLSQRSLVPVVLAVARKAG